MSFVLVILESRYAPSVALLTRPCDCYHDLSNICETCVRSAQWHAELRRNLSYARACMKDCLQRGEAPFASHLLYTQEGVLDDTVPEEREWGIQAGFAWRQVAQKTVVYTDLGISKGMQYGIDDAAKRGSPVEFRTLPGWKE